jgi:hypothetical protein
VSDRLKLVVVRLLPVLLLAGAAAAVIISLEGPDSYAIRNLFPLACVILLALITLLRGDGHWLGSGWRWPLGVVGFAIPAVGLSLYLHYAYAVDLDGIFGDSPNPEGVFQYLPLYTAVSGSIGFAIGWIVGSRV